MLCSSVFLNAPSFPTGRHGLCRSFDLDFLFGCCWHTELLLIPLVVCICVWRRVEICGPDIHFKRGADIIFCEADFYGQSMPSAHTEWEERWWAQIAISRPSLSASLARNFSPISRDKLPGSQWIRRRAWLGGTAAKNLQHHPACEIPHLGASCARRHHLPYQWARCQEWAAARQRRERPAVSHTTQC